MYRTIVSDRRRVAGFTLVEMMVALVVGLVISLILMSTLSMFEGRKRSVGSVADLDNAGNTAMAEIDRLVRSAGSGIAQSSSNSYGCQLNYVNTSDAAASLPAPALPNPFGNVLATIGSIRVAPVLIIANNTPSTMIDNNIDAGNGNSDVLMVMGGTGGNSWYSANMYTPFTGATTASTLTLQNNVPFAINDLVLVMDTPSASGPTGCILEPVASAPVAGASTVTLSGNPSVAPISIAGSAVAIGNALATSGNYPNLYLLGVENDANGNGLFGYDLLQLQQGASALTAPTTTPIADSVMEVHALYGLATTAGSNNVDCWTYPTGSYSADKLMKGDSNASTILSQIRAIRIGLIIKSPLQEKANDVNASRSNAAFSNAYTAPTTLQLFQDLAGVTPGCPVAAYTRTLSPAEQQFRYRTVEETIPLRNTYFY